MISQTNDTRTVTPNRSAARAVVTVGMRAVSYHRTEFRTLPKPVSTSLSLCVFRCDLHLDDQAVGADISREGTYFYWPSHSHPDDCLHPFWAAKPPKLGVYEEVCAVCTMPPQLRHARLNTELAVEAELAAAIRIGR